MRSSVIFSVLATIAFIVALAVLVAAQVSPVPADARIGLSIFCPATMLLFAGIIYVYRLPSFARN